MELPLSVSDRIRNNLELGESQFREFKSAFEGPPGRKQPRSVTLICRDIGEQLVAFANADGGDLIIGVEDDGSLTGVPHGQEDLERMMRAPQTHVFAGQKVPLLHAGKVVMESVSLLFFSVAKGTSQIYQLPDGRCLRRKDRECVPVTFDAIQFERQEVRSREYERQFVDGATVNDLDLDELRIAANELLRGLSVERFLQQLGLGEFTPGGLRLRTAALLLYARDIRRWHPRCQIRILRVKGQELLAGERYNVAEDVPVEGNILQLIVRGWDQLRTFLVTGTRFSADAKFQTTLVYPEAACREALINAIAHRDYSIQNSIEVYVFDDRMEFRSPGALLSTLTVADLTELRGAHESRNPLIARVLRESRMMRELGEGMRRIFEAMEENEFEKPRIHSNGHSFTVTLWSRSLFSARELEYLAQFDALQLSRLQKRIVVAGMGGAELSQNDIYKAMNTQDRDTYDSEVTGLRQNGVLAEIRRSAQAQQLARTKGIDKAKIPRFKVGLPKPGARVSSPRAAITRRLFPEGTGVWVGNLPGNDEKASLRALFERFGEVREIIQKTSTKGNFALVFLDSEKAASEAIDGLYGVRLGNRELVLRRYRKREQQG